MKNLFENWRKYLTEAIDPRIKKQLDGLLALPDVAVAITSAESFGVAFRYVRVTDAESQQYTDLTRDDAEIYKDRKITKTGVPFGTVEIMKTVKQHDGPCYDGWMIFGTEAERGWGPLLYEVALEWASENGGGLMSDRGIVSKYALAVWDKYAQRGDVAARQMDVDHDLDQGWMKQYPELTPDDKSDDCDQGKAISMAGEKWAETSVSKIYKKQKPEVMQALKAAGRLIVV